MITDIAQNLSGNPLSNLYSSRMDIGNGGFYQINYGSTTLAALSSAPTGTYPYTGFNNFTQVGSTVVAQDRGYTLSNTIATQLSGGYVGYQMLFTTNTGSAFKVQYSLVRTPPPNNVQPTLSFSGIQNVNTTVSVSPSSLTIKPGQNVLLTANANYGNGTYTYQWYNNSACTSTISGATSSTYLASPTNTTIYCVKVTSGTSTATALSTVNINSAAACASVLNPLIAIITAIGVVAAVMILLSLFGPVTVMNITIEKMETRDLVKMLGFLVIGLLVVLILFYVVGIGINIIPSTACT